MCIGVRIIVFFIYVVSKVIGRLNEYCSIVDKVKDIYILLLMLFIDLMFLLLEIFREVLFWGYLGFE